MPYVQKDLREFVLNAPPDGPGPVVQMFIERKKGLTKLSPLYHLKLEMPGNTSRLIMVAQKMMSSKTAHYVISLDSEDLTCARYQRKPDTYLGKLRCESYKGTEYVLFDHGENPRDLMNITSGEGKDSKDDEYSTNPGLLRCEHSAVVFNFKKAEV